MGEDELIVKLREAVEEFLALAAVESKCYFYAEDVRREMPEGKAVEVTFRYIDPAENE